MALNPLDGISYMLSVLRILNPCAPQERHFPYSAYYLRKTLSRSIFSSLQVGAVFLFALMITNLDRTSNVLSFSRSPNTIRIVLSPLPIIC